jgi:transaldolase
VCTCPLESILGLLKHPLTDIGLAKFMEDAKKSASTPTVKLEGSKVS